MKKLYGLISVSILFIFCSKAQNRNYALEVSVNARYYNSTQSILDFKWRKTLPAAIGQRVYKKAKSAYVFGSVYKNIPINDTTFSDTITTGNNFEYRFEKDTAADGYTILGYINAGRRVPASVYQGKIILIVDSTNKTFLDTAIRTYRNDLIGDGWRTVLKWVSPSTTVAQIKTFIVSTYTADPTNVKSVVLIGDIAVPYSGNFRATGEFPPDGHTTGNSPGASHEGAWPADMYYGDIQSSNWTDASVTNNLGSYALNNNNVGDGKFDQTYITTLIDLQVGRIDLSGMSSFSQTERELLKQYFKKDHNFRHKIDKIKERCLVDDNFGVLNYPYPYFDENFNTNAYRNMAPLIADSVVKNLDYFTTLPNSDYLWSFGFGGGSFTSCGGVGNTSNFASSSGIKSVFTGLFGSYFGDWDNPNNFLRAPLAAKGNVLNSFWCGRPQYFMHHMGLGETIGYSNLRTQNNYDFGVSDYLYPSTSNSYLCIHPALMGDPAVRMQPVEPAMNFMVNQDSCSARFKMTWKASIDTAVHDYYIFRAKHIDSTFTLLGTTQALNFTDISPLSGNNIYMLRGLKLQLSGSGSYFNFSQGLFDTINTTNYYKPIANAGRDTAVCLNTYVRIGKKNSNSINTTYRWLPVSFTRDTTTVLASTGGNRILLATDTLSKCTVRDTMVITAWSLPVAETISKTANSCKDSVSWNSTLNNGNGFRYTWSFSGGSPNTQAGHILNNPAIVSYNSTGYRSTILTVTDTLKKCVHIDTSSIIVGCISLPIYIENFNCLNSINGLNVSFFNLKTLNFNSFFIDVLDNQNNWVSIKEVKDNGENNYQFFVNSELANNTIRLSGKLANGQIMVLDFCNGSNYNRKIKIYPNPASENLSIQIPSENINKYFEISVLDIYGRIISTENILISNQIYHINLLNYASGNYKVSIKFAGKTEVFNFIKL